MTLGRIGGNHDKIDFTGGQCRLACHRSVGTAAVAGVPALASARSNVERDPVFQAVASLERLKIHAEKVEADHSVAEDALVDAARGKVWPYLILDGEEMRTHEQIDDHFKPAFEDEEQFNRFVERLRPRHLSAPEAERDRARQAAHDELTRREAEIAEVEQRTGYREIEAQQESTISAVWDAEYEIMETKPATPAGAITLLRFVAGLMEVLFPDDDEHEHYVAADFFEGRASA
jgi:hypothetical protein